MVNVVFVFSWSLHFILLCTEWKKCNQNESTNSHLVSHKQCWWDAKQSHIPSFLIPKVLQEANCLLACGSSIYCCLFSLSVQFRRRYVKTIKEIWDDEKKWQKTKTSPSSGVGEVTATKALCPSDKWERFELHEDRESYFIIWDTINKQW